MFTLSMPATNRKLNLTDPGPAPIALDEKHRPQTLAAMVGQGNVTLQLESFLDAPYSTAFLFTGATGVGKSTAALAVARELGVGEKLWEDGNCEGLVVDAETVTRVLRDLHYVPMQGSGWKVVIVDEADYMSPKAAQIWLSALEDLPPRRVIIFTTNHPEKFQQRFLDRCQRLDFESDAKLHAQDAQTLIREVWTKEGGFERTCPKFADLKGVTDDKGHLSYRRVIRALEPLLRAEARKSRAAPAIAPTASQRPSRRVEIPTRSSYRMSFA
jgi:replication-associated recombination protein RarA